jgi:hypothetical protein
LEKNRFDNDVERPFEAIDERVVLLLIIWIARRKIQTEIVVVARNIDDCKIDVDVGALGSEKYYELIQREIFRSWFFLLFCEFDDVCHSKNQVSSSFEFGIRHEKIFATACVEFRQILSVVDEERDVELVSRTKDRSGDAR